MSNLLSQASLVMIPSGYKEDVVYSAIPTNGSGDLSFTRASNGTRINSAGLVEVCPWNLVQQSETFDNASWTKVNTTITANNTTAPNGTTTADKFAPSVTLTATYFSLSQEVVSGATSQAHTAIIYAKAGGLTQMLMYLGNSIGIYWNLSNGQFISYYSGAQTITNYSSEAVGDGWYKYTISISSNSGSIYLEVYGAKSGAFIGNYTTADNCFVWGAQLNIGSTAKPYFPTTDRLNVPRLTYQNGGGGCPSLLLEKQSTNLVSWSDDFSNSDWGKYQCSVSTNQTTSPDGTQNADKLTLSGNSGTYTGLVYRTTTPAANSIYMKNDSIGSGKFYIQVDGVGNAKWNSDGTLNSVSGGTATNGENMGNGWFRFAYVVTSGAYINCGIVDGTTGDSIFIWGAQVEAGSYPTSLINTTSSSATRVADACSKTGISSLIGQSEGVLFADFVYLGETQSEVIDISDGTENNRVMIYINFGGQFQVYVTTGGSTDGFITTSFAPSVGSRYKIAVGYKSNDIVFYVNGTSLGTDTSATIPATSKLTISNGGASNYLLASQFNEAVLFKTRLTNAELASITSL